MISGMTANETDITWGAVCGSREDMARKKISATTKFPELRMEG